MPTPPRTSEAAAPSAREIYQRLREAALGVRDLRIVARSGEGEVRVDIDGWALTLLIDAEGLARCLDCRTATGGCASLDDWPRYGTNPVDLLSLWERQRVERAVSGD
ncbi:DUF7693 family protein [Pseudomonas sp. MLB6B]